MGSNARKGEKKQKQSKPGPKAKKANWMAQAKKKAEAMREIKARQAERRRRVAVDTGLLPVATADRDILGWGKKSVRQQALLCVTALSPCAMLLPQCC